MKTKRKLIAVIAAFAFVVSVLSPVKVFANDGTYSMSISKTEGASFNNAGVEVLFYDEQNAGGQQIGMGYFGINEENFYNINTNNNVFPEATRSMVVKVTSAGQDLDTSIVRVNGTNVADNDALLSNNGQTINLTVADPLEFEFVIGNAGGGNNQPSAGGTDIEFDITWVGTDIVVELEGTEIMPESNLFDQKEYTFKDTVNVPATTDPEEFNLFHFRPRFGDKAVTEYEINGIVYKEGMEGVELGGPLGDEWYITVPGDRQYTIYGRADENSVVPRTIIWTNPDYVPKDAEDEEWVSDFKIDHGFARAMAIYDAEGNPVEVENYGLKDGFGWVMVYPGYKVDFEFVPEYGYQLTGIALNETPMDASSVMNHFTIEIPNDKNAGNVHFAATFTKTEDIVKANSKTVDSGTIALGSALNGGSAQLTVNDIELSSDKIADFEKAAGDYTISDYLDIDLYNVFYKGKADANDVWSNEITELDKDATIAIKLAEGVSADDIVIVHNIHDGKEFEVLQIESYDAATNTITFKTKSFSNYAIATKASIKDTTSPSKNAMSADLNNSVEELKKSVLTAADLKALDAGEDINIWLEVKDAASTVDATEKSKVETAAQEASADYKIGAYLDIDLFKQVGTQKSQLTSTNGKIKITLTLPTALQGDYTYKIVQVHDGKVTLLDATYDKTTHTLTFETDKFSTYAIIYKGTAKAAESTTAAAEAKTSPKTGDAAEVAGVLLFAIFGALSLIYLGSKKRMMK